MTVKNIFFALMLGTLSLYQLKAQEKNARSLEDLKGNVKAVRVEEGGIREVSGKIREKCCYFSYSITYDVDGNIVNSKAAVPPIDYGPINPPKKEARYDDKGNVIEELTYKSNGSLLMKTVYAYDANGNKIEESIYSANGSLYQKGIFIYNTKKNLTEYVVHYGDSTPLTRETYSKHDAKGNWLRQLVWHWNSQNKKWEPFTVRYRTITYH